MKIYKSITELIGNTPLVELEKYCKSNNLKSNIIAKLERCNPGGSAKDRIAYAMICDAEEKGLLSKGSVIIEPTSGNTGIGLSMVAASRGYKVILTMPETMSIERRKLLSAYGAQIVLTDGKKGMVGAIEEAEKLHREIENSYIPGQFENPSNPVSHIQTTGPEIWSDTDGKVDILVAGIGTGGTLSGTGKYLKSKNSDIQVVGVEPANSPIITEGKSGSHGIQGIGANFIPENLDMSIVDEIITIYEEDAYNCARQLSKQEGILSGISSGAALFAATVIGKRKENEGKNIIVILPDTGERYLSTRLFEN